MSKVLKFKDFTPTKLNENAEMWGYAPVGITGPNITPAIDRGLSYDSYDQHITNIKNQTHALIDFTRQIMSSPDYPHHSRRIEINEIKSLKILKQTMNENFALDLFLEFKFDDEEDEQDELFRHHATFRDWGRYGHTTFECDCFDHTWKTEHKKQLEKKIIHILNNWYQPTYGKYRVLKEHVRIWDELNNPHFINKDQLVEVKKVYLEGGRPEIEIETENRKFWLADDDYFWFKWWFKMEEEVELEL